MFDICKKKKKTVKNKSAPKTEEQKPVIKEDKPEKKPFKKKLKPKEKKIPLNEKPGWEFCNLFTPAKLCYSAVIIVTAGIIIMIPVLIKVLASNTSVNSYFTPPPIIPGKLWRTCCISNVDNFEYNCNINWPNTDIYCDPADSKYVYILCLEYGVDACAISFIGPSLAIRYRYKSYYLNMVSSPDSYLIIMRNAVSSGIFFQKDFATYTKSMFYNDNFWMGLNNLHNFTNRNSYKTSLKILIKHKDATAGLFAVTYSTFRVGPASGNHVLEVAGFATASASRDALGSPVDPANGANGMPFAGSTAPATGRKKRLACSKIYGWWWNTCSVSVLTADDGVGGWEFSATATDISRAVMAIKFTAV